MTHPNEADVASVLDELVNQFTDPMAFFRELIQNAIDAGSLEVDIRVEFEPGESPDSGFINAHIDDFGEGMTREIIEGKLTRLFSSTKEDDYTKIGRFGIGFVSVFAIQPDVVIVDTARGGEAWRIIFHGDRTWDLIRLDIPGEGTQIRVVKSATLDEFHDFRHRAKEVIERWCKHVEVPIYFDGQDIRQDFDVNSPCKITYDEEGTRVVAGYSMRVDAPFGFYNRGLTLKEGSDGRWPMVTFKMDSRYLEHTLTRDRVLEDKNFHKAMALLEKVSEHLLPDQLFAELERCLGEDEETYRDLLLVLARLNKTRGELLKNYTRRAIFLTVTGERVSLAQIAKPGKSRRVVAASRSRHLDPFVDDRFLAVHVPFHAEVRGLLERVAGREVVTLDDVICLPESADLTMFPGMVELVVETQHLLETCLKAATLVEFGHFDYPGSRVEDHFAWAVDGWRPVEFGDIPQPTVDTVHARSHLIVNASHPAFPGVLHTAETEPEWAALQLLKLVFVPWGLGVEIEDQLSRQTLLRRQTRLREAS